MEQYAVWTKETSGQMVYKSRRNWGAELRDPGICLHPSCVGQGQDRPGRGMLGTDKEAEAGAQEGTGRQGHLQQTRDRPWELKDGSNII